MADELTILTENAAGTSWVDLSAAGAGESTSYQAQNTNINANRNGIDLSYVRYDSGTDEIVIEESGPIDDNGLPFAVGQEIRFANPGAGTWYLRVIPGSTAVDRELEITSSKGTWDGSKNALYDSVPRRVLNWVIVNGDNGTTVTKLLPLTVFGSMGNLYGDIIDMSFVRLYPAAGVKSSFASPNTTPAGLAYDSSTGNLISCDTGANLIYIHNGITSSILSSFASPSTGISGITYDSSTGNLISCDVDSDLIYIHNGITSSILSSFASPDTRPRGLTYDSSTGNLISCDDNAAHLIYIHNGITSSILSSFASPDIDPYGLAYDSSTGNLISCDTTADSIYIHSSISSSILISFASPSSRPEGLTYNTDLKNLISCDANLDKIYIHKRQLYYND